MKRLRILFLFVIAGILPAHVLAEENEFCNQIYAFQTAPFEKDSEGKPLRRAIEFHWIGFWMDFEHGFGTECQNGGTAPGKALCNWLPENTSREFPSTLPLDILSCYGWKIPGHTSDFDIRKATLKISTDKDGNELENSDRYLQLEIDMQARKRGDMAIRLSVIPWDEKFLNPQPRLKIKEPVDEKMEEDSLP
jgi:hypothetical protein